eukprot:GDKK01024522.1.p1 GENE.GDKK01024522.1~~GDKK01024522.1.p1  ORF type:complete len:574 (-),score=226.68 GDKK01024522.1:453-2174(-)
MSDCASDPTGNLWKNEGNDHLNAGRVKSAIESYTKAIECDSKNHIFFSNRSAAYFKLLEYQNALKDADECIALNPEFAKGHTRRAQCLLALERFEECYEACAASNKLESNNRVNNETIKACKKGYFLSLIRGEWIGTMCANAGGYDQILNFIDDETVELGVMGSRAMATYSVNLDKDPMWLNLVIPPPPEMVMQGITTPQDMPYIFKIDCSDAVSILTQRVDARSMSKTQAKKLSLADRDLPTSASEMTVCFPLKDTRRPTSFSGDGVCLFKRISAEDEARRDLCFGIRKVCEDIVKMSEEEQLLSFCKAMIEVLPSTPPTPPGPNSTSDEQNAFMNESVRVQKLIFEIDQKYPEEISAKVQEYTSLPIEKCPEFLKESITKLKSVVGPTSGGMPEGCSPPTPEEVEAAAMYVYEVLNARGVADKIPEQERMAMIQQRVMEVQLGKEGELERMIDEMLEMMAQRMGAAAPGAKRVSAQASKILAQKEKENKIKKSTSTTPESAAPAAAAAATPATASKPAINAKAGKKSAEETPAVPDDSSSSPSFLDNKVLIGAAAGVIALAVAGFVLFKRK